MSDRSRNLTAETNPETLEPDSLSAAEPLPSDSSADHWQGGISPARTALVVWMTVLAVGLGCAYAVYRVFGGGDLTQLPSLPQETLVLLLAAAGGLVLVAGLSAWAIASSAASARRRYRQAEDLIEAVATLDFQGAQRWQDPQFRVHPPLAAFTTSVWNRYVLLKDREQRNLGLIGEVVRLENGLVNGKRNDLDSTYEHADVNRLAYEVLELFDKKTEVEQQLRAKEDQLQENGRKLGSELEGALGWNTSALDRLNLQISALEKLVRSTETLAVSVQQARHRSGSEMGVDEAVESATAALADNSVADMKEVLEATAESITELADLQGNLAFQIAVKVAPLGEKGEPLLPLVQELEGMTADFKSFCSQLDDLIARQSQAVGAMAKAASCLEGLKQAASADQEAAEAWREVADQVNELLPALSQSVSVFNQISPEFNEQTERLNDLGRRWAEMTGGEFVPSEVVAVAPVEIAEPSLSNGPDRVYDLSEFDAVALDDTGAGSGDQQERIHDLSEFGAVAIS